MGLGSRQVLRPSRAGGKLRYMDVNKGARLRGRDE